MVTSLTELLVRAATPPHDAPTSFDIALAAGATLIAAAFGLSALDRWLRRHRPPELAWTIAMALFSLATGALWYGFARGWSTASFRVFYLAGGILNVPWLALGTVYLLGGERIGNRVRAWLVGLSGLSTGVLLAAPTKSAVDGRALPAGRDVFGAFPRVLAAVGSGVAALVIIGGAVWTAWRFWRQRRSEMAAQIPGTRLAGTVIVAFGTIALSSAGSFNARLGESRAFAAVTAAGVAILFVGFLVANASPARRDLRDTSSGGTT